MRNIRPPGAVTYAIFGVLNLNLKSSASLTALSLALISMPAGQVFAQSEEGASIAQADGGDGEAESGVEELPAYDEDTIVVLGARLFGQVDTQQTPLLELDEQDIAAYGAGSIAELIEALGSQVTGARGRGGGQVILVNGERISSFRELRSYPPEAIEKFEVFPEEVALQYGYSADQRVINIILKDSFASKEIEVEYQQPWDGGFSSQEVEATYLQVDGPSRFNINLGWENSSLLTEAERGIIQTTPSPTFASDPDPADYRSLRSDTADIEATVNWSTRLSPGNSLSLNATYERGDSRSLQGLDTITLIGPAPELETAFRTFNANDPLDIDRRTESFAGAAALSTSLGDWDITATVDANHTKTRSVIQSRLSVLNSQDYANLLAAAADGSFPLDGQITGISPGGFDEALTKTTTASGLVTARSMPITLPAGDVNVTIDAGYNWNRINSEDTRNPGLGNKLTRGDLTGGVNVAIPITSTVDEVLAFAGDITLNANAGIDYLSDFGTLYDWSLGLFWGLSDRLSVNVNYTNRDAAPSLGQLGNPEIATQNVPVFDLVNNETVLVTVISGGNPLLPAQSQSDWRVGFQWQLPILNDAQFGIDYVKNRSTDVAAAFPVLTPEIEAAFSDRVTRDSFGTLLQIDQRAVTYAQQDQERLQFNFNISGEISGGSEEGSGGDASQATGPANGGPVQMAGGPAGGQAGGPPAGGQGGFPGAGGFAQMRESICAGDAAALQIRLNEALSASASGETAPDGLTLPSQMLQMIAGDDGEVSAEEAETLYGRMCSGQGPGGGGFMFGGPGGPGGEDQERLAEMRATFCEAEASVLRDQFNQAIMAARTGEQLTGEDGAAINLPPQLLQALGGEDGVIDADEFAALRLRICDPEAAAAQGEGGPSAGGPPGGFAGGPPRGGGGPPGGGGGFRGPPIGAIMGAGGRPSGGRWFFNVQYNLELTNETLIAPGIPVLDLLDGSALSGGGQPRHTANFRLGTFFNGFGAFWTGQYTGKSRINGSGQVGSTDLFFDDYFTLGVRAFADLGAREGLVEAVPFFEGTRLGIGVDNIFDARQTVTDSTGAVPLRYQPYLIDPVGRRFEIEFRKMF